MLMLHYCSATCCSRTALAVCSADVTRWFREAHQTTGEGKLGRDEELCRTVAFFFYLGVVAHPDAYTAWAACNTKVGFVRPAMPVYCSASGNVLIAHGTWSVAFLRQFATMLRLARLLRSGAAVLPCQWHLLALPAESANLMHGVHTLGPAGPHAAGGLCASPHPGHRCGGRGWQGVQGSGAALRPVHHTSGVGPPAVPRLHSALCCRRQG